MYRLLFYLKISYQNLILHKVRMTLAVLGILFAVMSLFAFGNISEGMKAKIDMEMGRFGRNLVIVRAGLFHPTPRGMRAIEESRSLKLSDLNTISQHIEGVVRVVPFFDTSCPVRYRGHVVRAQVVGATPDLFLVKDIRPMKGRLYGQKEETVRDRVAVIGFKVFKNLFSEDPIGKHVLVHRIPTEVIGVLEEKGVDYTGQDQDLQIFIPLSSFTSRYRNVDYVRGAYIQLEEREDLRIAKERIRGLLRELHGLKETRRDDFSLFTMDDIIRTKQEGVRLVSILTIISSVVSFIIGGLGIFAIMLLTVAERKVEIGMRRAVGSRKKDIILQFITESAIIAGVGGIAGLLAGFIVTLIVDRIGDFPFTVKISTLVFSLVVTTFVGLLAGSYPAVQGSRYEPVQVLHG